jgi:VanZ family protein
MAEPSILRAHGPAAAWGALVGVLLLMPVGDLPAPPNWLPAFLDSISDKLVHAALFFAGVLTLARSARALRASHPLAAAVLAAIAYGGLLELLQGSTGRDASWGDLGADALGASLAALPLPLWPRPTR